jgi:hypothetical protein
MNRIFTSLLFFLVFQVLILDQFSLFDHSRIILFYLGFLFLPFALSNMTLLLIIFSVSLLYDYYHLHLGMVTSILLAILLLRRFWVRRITPSILLENNMENFDPLFQNALWILLYITPFIFLFNILHCFVKNMRISFHLLGIGILNGLICTVIGFFLAIFFKQMFVKPES